MPGGIGLRDLGEQRLKDLGRAERVFQVTGSGLAEEFGVLRSLDDPALRHNLPSQATSFVGRAVELAELRVLVSGGSRLVTIAGPGGIGKSRLALQVAADALDGPGDGVWLAELAPVAEPELVPRTAAAALRISDAPGRPMLETVVDAIGDRELLLILDNAEQVLEAVAELAAAVIRSCPRVCLLVTSREPLGISGEHVFRVPGLAVPPADLADPARLTAFESVQLFVEHAALHQRGFIVDDTSAAAVAAICVRLDGIPLALELAAARLSSLSAPEISARLDQRFRLLTTGNRTALPRHQTLRALIDWSYDLLSPDEQTVLKRLSVFAGGWTLEAAEAVARGGAVEEWQVLDLLAALVGKSLVQAEVIDGATRYRLLETIRHYAAERLRCGLARTCRTPASPTAIITCPSSRPRPRSCAARTNSAGLTGSRPSSTTSAPRWRSASLILPRARPAAGGGAEVVLLHARPQRGGHRGARRSARATRRPPADSLPSPGPDREVPPAQ